MKMRVSQVLPVPISLLQPYSTLKGGADATRNAQLD
jgi:hypothetical protein